MSVLRSEDFARRVSEFCLTNPPTHTQVPAFSFLLEIQPCLDGQSTEETEAATSVSETASSSSGALPAAGDPQTTADSTSAASDEQLAYDAVLLCAHTRCHALRALALQMQHPESAVVALRGGLLTPLLTLATTDLAAAPPWRWAGTPAQRCIYLWFRRSHQNSAK